MSHLTRERHPSFSRLLLAGVLFFQPFMWVVLAQGQGAPVPREGGSLELRLNDIPINNTCDETRRLVVTVLNGDKARLDRQAVVKIHDQKRDITTWQTTSNESEIIFCNIDFGDYDVDASAVGYLTEHKPLHVVDTAKERRLEIVLRNDPLAVDLNGSDSALPAATRKDVKRAVAALKSANLKEAQKRLDKAYKSAPSSGQINFLFGYLFMQRKDFEKAEQYLSRAATLDPRRAQTLTLLGRVQLQREQYEDAQKTLEQAVLADSGYWLAHDLLADAYLRQKEYDKAREQAQLAIDQGKATGSVAQLALGQALANVGRNQEGIQALKTFLQTNPDNPAVPQVKALIAEIERRDSGQSGTVEIRLGADLTLAASQPSLPESAWGPPGVDDEKPAAVPGVVCPYQQVIEGSGERVKQLVDNITKFAAIEDLVHEQLDKTGNPITKETRKFNYVASISEPRPGFIATDEYRDLRYGFADLPDRIVTMGFVTLALIFHPDMRENYQMTCEGLGEWRGQTAWLMYFRQRDDKPNRFAEYKVGTESYPMKLKGRAWITTDNLRIVRIESDLAETLPGFPVQHQIAEYGPVHFAKTNADLWLPQNVDIFLELNRHRYYRRHSFDHYMLFSVDSTEKSQMIKSGAGGGPVQNP